MPSSSLLVQVDKLLRSGKVRETRIGRDAMGDPNFVRDLRQGRVVRPATEAKILEYLSRVEQSGEN